MLRDKLRPRNLLVLASGSSKTAGDQQQITDNMFIYCLLTLYIDFLSAFHCVVVLIGLFSNQEFVQSAFFKPKGITNKIYSFLQSYPLS